MRKLLLFFFTFFISSLSAQAQQFKWVRGGGTSEDLSTSPSWEWEQTEYMCTDVNGNIYALSQVGTNPIIADTFYSATGAYGSPVNIFLTSYTCNGQMRWAKLIAATDETIPYGIVADSLGHIYVAGHFEHVYGTHTFYIGYDTSIGIEPFLAAGLIQFDTNGHYNWVRFVGNSTPASLAAINPNNAPLVMDGVNNVHFFPYMKPGVPITSSITSQYGVYDLTYNTSGTLVSAVRLDMDSEWYLNNAVIDPATNKLYVSGQIDQYIYGGFLTDTFYAAAFDASRNLLWQYFCGHGDDDGIVGIVMDKSKHLYFCGNAQPLSGPTTFSFNGDSVSAPFDNIAILLKTDTNGTVKWIKHYDSHTADNALISITLLPNNKVAATGAFEASVTNGTVTIYAPASEGANPYLVVVDSEGDLQTMQEIYGDGDDEGIVITSDRVGNIYIGGEVTDSIWAGTPSIPAYYTVGGNTDFFVMKYGVDCSCTSMPIASYIDTGAHTVGVTYTGTTAGIDSLVWSFGDGATAYGTTALHTYTAIGTYQLCITVYTDCGQDSICNDVVVTCVAPPLASFTDTGVHTVGFIYTGSTTGIDSLIWNFGDGHSDTGLKPMHTYTVSGSYRVCVFAFNACGVDSSCNTIAVTVPRTGITSVNLYNEAIQVYPNPANDALNIMGITETTNYRLLSITGTCMMQGVFEAWNNILPMKEVVPGIYILELNSENGERNIVRVVKE